MRRIDDRGSAHQSVFGLGERCREIVRARYRSNWHRGVFSGVFTLARNKHEKCMGRNGKEMYDNSDMLVEPRRIELPTSALRTRHSPS